MGLTLIGNKERLGELSIHGAVLKGNLFLCFQNKYSEEVEEIGFLKPITITPYPLTKQIYNGNPLVMKIMRYIIPLTVRDILLHREA